MSMNYQSSLVNVGGTGLPIDFPTNFLDREEGDRLFVNTSGDAMIGTLSMNGKRIIDLADPKNVSDASNKLYVDNTIETVKKDFQTHVVPKIRELERKADDKDKAMSSAIRELKDFLLPKIPKVAVVISLFAKELNINNLVFTFPSTTINNSMTLLEPLIETKPGNWFNMYLMSPSYVFRIYRKENRMFVVSSHKLPDDWTRRLKFSFLKI